MLKDNIYGYTDSDYAMDPDTCHSVSGAIFLLMGGPIPISWRLKLQASISQSSTEAAKEAIWLWRVMHDLKQDISHPTSLFIDNCEAQLLAKNPINHTNMKHIDIQHHFIQECIANGSIIL